ncbi:MAG: hypothetical protein KKG59_04070 [Nanoarchaeota archaeon]|nr:hypothetical protein [Nanoarchaeota archaeon]
MKSKILFPIIVLLAISFVFGDEMIPKPVAVGTQEPLVNEDSSPYEAPDLFEVLIFILIPLIVTALHGYLGYRLWTRTWIMGRIFNSLVLLIGLFFTYVSIHYAFIATKGIDIIFFAYIIGPFFICVLLGWLIRYLVVKGHIREKQTKKKINQPEQTNALH